MRSRTARQAAAVEQLGGYESGPDAPIRATADAVVRAEHASTVVLVEGISDQIAIETLAKRMGRDLAAERIVVVPIGGAQAISHFVQKFRSQPDVRILGLCDRAEATVYEQAFGVEAAGSFFACDPDLEHELIRAMDRNELEALIESEGELGALRTMQKQSAWIGRDFTDQVHRWIRTRARRSSRYALLVVSAAPEDRLPAPLVDLVNAL